MAKIIYFLLVLTAGCSNLQRRPSTDPTVGSLVLTDSAFGNVVFGSKLQDVEEMLGERPYVLQDAGSCKMVGFMKVPQVQFMVEDGLITRADSVPGSAVVTESGIRIGSSAERAKRKLSDLKVSDHKYIDGGHYLTELSRNQKRAMIFEEVDGKVEKIRAGLMPSVGYIQQCL